VIIYNNKYVILPFTTILRINKVGSITGISVCLELCDLYPLYPRERPGTDCIGGRVGPRAGLNGCGKCRLYQTPFPPHLNGGIHFIVKKEIKAIPLQALTGPEGSMRSRLPYFKTIGT
jgi:hypothetical protein